MSRILCDACTLAWCVIAPFSPYPKLLDVAIPIRPCVPDSLSSPYVIPRGRRDSAVVPRGGIG